MAVEPPRFDLPQLNPEAYRHLTQLETLIARHVEPTLYHLIKLRASQINGCAFCLAMHTDQALHHGETPERIVSLDAWEESPLYTDKERAALAWTEALTSITEGHVPDAVYEEARKQFSEKELVDLTYAVMAINAWNRIAIAFRKQPVLSRASAAA